MIRTLNILAGIIWYLGAFMLLQKGIRLLLAAERIDGGQSWTWTAFVIGILFGLIKARYLMFKSCQKNLARIASLENPRWWQFYRPQFFLFLAIVIPAGFTAGRMAEGHYLALCIIGAIDLSIGAGLFLSGAAFFQTECLVEERSL